MGKVQFDLSKVQGDARQFPNGPCEAIVNKAEAKVSRNTNPMIELEFEIYHPEHGTATVRDWLPSNFPNKVAAFWQAFNGMTKDEVRSLGNVDIDPRDLVGGNLIVHLGDTPGTNKDGEEVVYKNIVAPWYYSPDRTDLIPYLNESVEGEESI